eukprot:maker-scaffold_2-snap-gene-7.21-mRNA-1 protein AED:0.00 eAED:0.00 QI:329/1/1/1/1/1/5/142/514
MESFEEQEGIDDPAINLLLQFIAMDIPRTPKGKEDQVDYNGTIGGNLHESVRKMLRLATQQRRVLVQGLTYAGTEPDPSNVIEAVNVYMPQVWHIQKSLEESKSTKIKMKGELVFKWKSGLHYQKDVLMSQKVFVFEMAFLLAVKAISHYNYAGLVISRLNLNNKEIRTTNIELISMALKTAIKLLRQSAGIFEYSATEIVSIWRKPPPKEQLLPEIDRDVLHVMSAYVQCMAQRLIIVKAILNKQYSILPQLFAALGDRYERIQVKLANSGKFDYLRADLVSEVNVFIKVSKTFGHRYAAKKLLSDIDSDTGMVNSIEDTYALSVEHLRKAASLFTKKIAVEGLKSEFKTSYSSEKMYCMELFKYHANQNSTVYFGNANPDDAELPPPSQQRFVITAEKYEMPEVEVLSFEQVIKAPPGVDQDFFNAMPDEEKKRLLEEHKAKVAAEAKIEEERKKAEKAANKRNWFGKKKVNPAGAKEAELVAPDGVDPAVFAEMDDETKKLVISMNKENKS